MLKLSVIVPFYNVQQFAADMLRALAGNARRDFEFILVDDCSTDRTAEILEDAVRGPLPGARLIRHERNGGLATARNTGLDAAQGEYVTFLDGDDWIAPGYLSALLARIEQLGCDFVRTDHVQVTGRERTVHRVPHGPRDEAGSPRDAILPAHRSTSVDYPYAWAGMYHRRLLDAGLLHFTDGLRTAEDRPWIWRLHREAESFAAVGLLGVFYRRGVAGSLTQIGDIRQLDFIRSFDQVLAETAEDPRAEEFLPKAVRTYCAIISHHAANTARFEPKVARRFRALSARAMDEMPQHLLAEALDAMDVERSVLLRRIRRFDRTIGRLLPRPSGTAGAPAAAPAGVTREEAAA